MASAQVVETSVTNNSPSQDSNHPDDLFQSRYVTPGFKPFSHKNDNNDVPFFFYQILNFDFSNSLTFHEEKTKEMTIVNEVWICDPNNLP